MFEERSLFKIDGYTVVRELTEGSFGVICEVTEVQTQKSYALKALLKSYLIKTHTMKQARLEGLLLEVLDHPGIVKLHQIREDENYLYLIMQLGGQGDLRDFLSNTTRKEQWRPETKRTLAQILDTIIYLHSNGIVHCDIKPENIVIMNKGNPKLVDFGTAKIFDRELLNAQVLQRWDSFVCQQKSTGSAEFISPEGINGQATPARDIWAFGVLVYWIFHGKLPFVGGSNLQLFQKIRDSEPHIQQTLSQAAKQLITQCLKKDPNERPTAAQLKFSQYFQEIDFKHLFQQKQKFKPKGVIEFNVQKRMFFGNFKSRILRIFIQNNQLFLGYSYPQTGVLKRKLKLEPSDFAQVSEQTGDDRQFYVRTRQQKLHFKADGVHSCSKIIKAINHAIKSFYQL